MSLRRHEGQPQTASRTRATMSAAAGSEAMPATVQGGVRTSGRRGLELHSGMKVMKPKFFLGSPTTYDRIVL